MRPIYLTLIVIFFCNCSVDNKKLFIKSTQIENAKRVDWYCHSLIGGFSRSYLQLADKNEENVFFDSFYLSDFTVQKDTLTIQVYKNNYKLDKDKMTSLGLIVKVDTTGGIWNGAVSRLGRLQGKGIDFTHYHFTDSYCPKNECY